MPPPLGLLLVTMEPPASMEEEFNDWYDTEHFPQRAALPGFRSASRWVCISGWPRWLALYDLDSIEALDTPEYLAVSGPLSTPWSKRILPRTIGRRREILEQMLPAPNQILNAVASGSLILASYSVATPGQLMETYNALETFSQTRVFQTPAKVGNLNEASEIWVIAWGANALTISDLPLAVRAKANTFDVYRPYYRLI